MKVLEYIKEFETSDSDNTEHPISNRFTTEDFYACLFDKQIEIVGKEIRLTKLGREKLHLASAEKASESFTILHWIILDSAYYSKISFALSSDRMKVVRDLVWHGLLEVWGAYSGSTTYTITEAGIALMKVKNDQWVIEADKKISGK